VVSSTEDADAEVDGTVVEPARGEDTRWCRGHDALDDKAGEEIGRSMTELTSDSSSSGLCLSTAEVAE
jgi:hypothetical protein